MARLPYGEHTEEACIVAVRLGLARLCMPAGPNSTPTESVRVSCISGSAAGPPQSRCRPGIAEEGVHGVEDLVAGFFEPGQLVRWVRNASKDAKLVEVRDEARPSASRCAVGVEQAVAQALQCLAYQGRAVARHPAEQCLEAVQAAEHRAEGTLPVKRDSRDLDALDVRLRGHRLSPRG